MKRGRLAGVLVGAIAAVGLSTLLVSGVGAAASPAASRVLTSQTAGQNQTSPAAPPVAPGNYSGTVVQNGPTLVTHDSQGDRQLTVQPGATVNRDGKPVAISSLKKGDKITAMLDATGIVQRIDASSPGTDNSYLAWLIPLIVAALLVLGLLLWLMKRPHHTGFLMERKSGRRQAV